MRIAILAFEGSMLSAISGLADIFWITNQSIEGNKEGLNPSLLSYKTTIVSPDGNPVPDGQGRRIPVEGSFESAGTPDIILVAGMVLTPDRIPVASEAIKASANWLRSQYDQGVLIGAACAGGFVLGDAGLLDGRSCTTTWWLYHTFKERYPKARPVWGTSLEEHDRIITTGGPLSWIELALHIIRRFSGPDIARLAADMAVADSQPISQRTYAPQGFVNTRHPLLLRAEHIIRYKEPGITAENLAKELNISHRTLHRKLKLLTDENPKDFITRVRIESACVLLRERTANIGGVATKCGYRDDTVFRRAFSQLMGMTPTQYRKLASRSNP